MNFTDRVLDCGRYKLLQVLGTGAYGVVYRAIDLKTASSAGSPVQVAIKILDKRCFNDAAAERARREVVLHHFVSEHPNVVTMQHAFEDAMFVYIVMDYCPGGDLFSRIADDKMFFRNDDLTKSVFLKILDAVAYCHQKRVYHRDLKPENILCSKDGSQVYVSDFGLCTSGLVSTTWGCGSAPYMSPECVGKEAGYLPYSNRTSDIWALGIILINMITSRSPWQKAITSDDCFCEFLLNEGYLREKLPISREANALFRKIFVYEPSERITLSALRREIIALPTFFMNDEELASAGEVAREVAESCGVRVVPIQGGLSAKLAKMVSAVRKRTPAKPPHVPAPREDDLVVPSLDVSDATSSTLPSSMGPVTPGSYPGQHEIYFSGLQLQFEGFEQAGLIKDEKMPQAPRTRHFAKVHAA
ncbi:kinase-like domain-containing protein [Irpex rosettiformis]|uniref:Kinase-like domain-containing protein n=1 Tax=Irpex rosettiformis TaxID=378272 RepID=A0ACB8U3U7_9APHY|nr:kinase-like domain-containing protein [Irpex rosettiformis]